MQISWPSVTQRMASRKARSLVCVYGSSLGDGSRRRVLGERGGLGVEEGGSLQLHDPFGAHLGRGVEHVAGADHVDRSCSPGTWVGPPSTAAEWIT